VGSAPLIISSLLGSDIFRYEKKYHIRSEYDNLLKISIIKHPALFRLAFPARYINNIYFDTKDYSHYWDNVEGLAKRIKVRIRWYGDQFGSVSNPVLEFKIKDNMTGSKLSFHMSNFNVDSSLLIEQIHEQFKLLPIDKSLKEYLLTLNFVLMNRYYRDYFISQDNDFRLTVDKELSFIKLSNRENYFLNKIDYPYSKILELKYDAYLEPKSSFVSSALPFRMTRSSKYIYGAQLLKIL
jgi:hypothetical protein